MSNKQSAGLATSVIRLRRFYELLDSGSTYTHAFKQAYDSYDHDWDAVDKDQEALCRDVIFERKMLAEIERGRRALEWIDGNYHWLFGQLTADYQADLDAILDGWKP